MMTEIVRIDTHMVNLIGVFLQIIVANTSKTSFSAQFEAYKFMVIRKRTSRYKK